MYFRSRKKLQGEVSLNDSLDSDADGESLYLMDVVGVEDTMYLDIQDRDDCLQRAKARARVPDRAGERGHHLALRPRRPDAPHTARGRQKTRHLEELCIASELM